MQKRPPRAKKNKAAEFLAALDEEDIELAEEIANGILEAGDDRAVERILSSAKDADTRMEAFCLLESFAETVSLDPVPGTKTRRSVALFTIPVIGPIDNRAYDRARITEAVGAALAHPKERLVLAGGFLHPEDAVSMTLTRRRRILEALARGEDVLMPAVPAAADKGSFKPVGLRFIVGCSITRLTRGATTFLDDEPSVERQAALDAAIAPILPEMQTLAPGYFGDTVLEALQIFRFVELRLLYDQARAAGASEIVTHVAPGETALLVVITDTEGRFLDMTSLPFTPGDHSPELFSAIVADCSVGLVQHQSLKTLPRPVLV